MSRSVWTIPLLLALVGSTSAAGQTRSTAADLTGVVYDESRAYLRREDCDEPGIESVAF